MNFLIKLRNVIEGHYFNKFGLPVVQCGSNDASKRALLIYLSQPIRWGKKDKRFDLHQNYRQSRQITELLIQRGYHVEVVQYNDRDFIPSDSYDLVIAHPGACADRLRTLTKTGYRLCIRTGRHADFVDQAVGERFTLLEERRGHSLNWEKDVESDLVYEAYDAIACFDANGTTAATFSEVGIPVYPFRNYANPMIGQIKKKSKNEVKGFLYLAGHLHILKGLDWLIESFAQRPELHLYICGRIPDELKQIYHEELALPNIHAMGFVSLVSKKFRHIQRETAWYVSPSASEGCSGAVLDSMAAGLIPIITEECGVDTHGVGISMQTPSLELLGETLDTAAEMSAAEVVKHSLHAREVIENCYQPQHFSDDWNRILDQVEAEM